MVAARGLCGLILYALILCIAISLAGASGAYGAIRAVGKHKGDYLPAHNFAPVSDDFTGDGADDISVDGWLDESAVPGGPGGEVVALRGLLTHPSEPASVSIVVYDVTHPDVARHGMAVGFTQGQVVAPGSGMRWLAMDASTSQDVDVVRVVGGSAIGDWATQEMLSVGLRFATPGGGGLWNDGFLAMRYELDPVNDFGMRIGDGGYETLPGAVIIAGVVPEPGTLGAIGLVGLLLARRGREVRSA